MNRNCKTIISLLAVGILSAAIGFADHDTPFGGNLKHTLNIAHFGNGDAIRSQVVLVNPNLVKSEVMVRFYDIEGERLQPEGLFTLPEGVTTSDDGELMFSMTGRSVFRLPTTGMGDLVSGSVWVQSKVVLKGYVQFLTTLGVTGVAATQPTKAFLVPVQSTSALAIANTDTEPGGVRCALVNDGEQVAAADFQLGANAKYTKYVREMFPDALTLSGLLECSSTRKINGLALDVGTDGMSSLPTISLPDRYFP